MFAEINIQTKVTLGTGAIITLTPAQEEQIKSLIYDVVTGRAVKMMEPKKKAGQTKKVSQKSVSRVAWTVEEKEALKLMLAAIPVGRRGDEATKLRRDWLTHLQQGQLSRHTKKQIYAMYYWIGSGKTKREAHLAVPSSSSTPITTWTPITIRKG